MIYVIPHGPAKLMLTVCRVVTMPSLCDHSVRHPHHSGSVNPLSLFLTGNPSYTNPVKYCLKA